MDAILDDIVNKEPLVTPSKMEQVRKLILRIFFKQAIRHIFKFSNISLIQVTKYICRLMLACL